LLPRYWIANLGRQAPSLPKQCSCQGVRTLGKSTTSDREKTDFGNSSSYALVTYNDGASVIAPRAPVASARITKHASCPSTLHHVLHLITTSLKQSSSTRTTPSLRDNTSNARCLSPACFLDSRAVPQRQMDLLQQLIYLALSRHCTEAR